LFKICPNLTKFVIIAITEARLWSILGALTAIFEKKKKSLFVIQSVILCLRIHLFVWP